jgi:LDH2 family malate/lactate/ureidoglycolate dehydrogenase
MIARGDAVDAMKLADFTARVLQKVGLLEADAKISAELLVETDLRGIDTHGVANLDWYVDLFKAGYINVKPDIKIFSRAPATAVMDGDQGFGFIVGRRAMSEAMDRAEKTGAGFIAVRNSTHFGAGGVYSMMALPREMIGISMTTGGLHMVVPGSNDIGCGNNVISIAAPTNKGFPFVLDMASTVVAAGKAYLAQIKGKAMPEGWAVTRDGKTLTDPTEFIEEHGLLLPLGGSTERGSYKGFGLAVAIDILTSLLSNALPTCIQLEDPNAERPENHFFGALRIDSFIPVSKFKEAMEEMIRTFESLPRTEGVDRITMAGQVEYETEKERRANGIPLHSGVLAALENIAKDLEIEFDL